MSWSNTNKINVPPLPGALDGAPFNGVTEENLGRNAMLSWTRVWNPTIITETRVGFTRLVTSRVGRQRRTRTCSKQFGIGGYNPTTVAERRPSADPVHEHSQQQYATQTYSQIGANNWLPSKEYSNVWDFIQNVSIIKGSHAMKFGAEYRPIKFPFFQVPYPHGEMYFNRNETAYPSVAGLERHDRRRQWRPSFSARSTGGQISTTNFISSEKVGMGVLRAGRLEGHVRN